MPIKFCKILNCGFVLISELSLTKKHCTESRGMANFINLTYNDCVVYWLVHMPVYCRAPGEMDGLRRKRCYRRIGVFGLLVEPG
ncbi:hypothetical protein L596_006062 [Steinernema carpocapsae]|uniref:Uncharacterized protein n=1 Tax=Steinernema carpocapsae TaxID=34508 RepID=A0A4U8V695_STECR|nr:hypothetical protein L596_006062 [Steinernema carpocapsae]